MRIRRRRFTSALTIAALVAVASVAGTTVPRHAHAQAQSDPGWGNNSVPSRPLEPGTVPPAPTDVSDPAWSDPYVRYPEPAVVEVDVPDDGLVQIDDLPIYVGPTEAYAGPDRIRVNVLDRHAYGLDGYVAAVELVRADGVVTPSRVRLAIDYSRFAYLGGDYVTRLGLVQLIGCQIGSLPDPTACRPTAIDEVNDLEARRIVADVPVSPDPSLVDRPGPASTTVALGAGSSGTAGSYAATPLSASNKWQVGPSSGDFAFTYDIPMPAAVAGPVPDVSLSYSSQSVDGRTASSNSQPSQAGEGWSFNLGQIERRFVPCADDGHPTWGDLCIGGSEYFLTLNGVASEIVRNGSSNEWRVRDDPGWRIQSLTGASNGTNAGDYWIVTTQDGTRYWFGRGTETTGVPTNGTLNVPVFGDDPGEACHNPASLAASYCMQAWRWNLDRIEDRNGNVATIFWHKEQNNYARNGNSRLVSAYNRAGFPQVVEYGQRAGTESQPAPSKLEIGVQYRCEDQTNCPAPSTNQAVWPEYPDVPLDLMCTSSLECTGPGHFTPTFWSAYQIDSFQTFTWNGSAYRPADKVALTFEFPATNEATSPSLWLKSIVRTGLRGTAGAISLPTVELGGVLLANRVDHDPANGKPAIHKYRLRQIRNETGTLAYVTYGQQRPCSAAALPAWDNNGTDCFPQYYKPDSGSPETGAFRKFHVRQLDVDDLVGPSPTQTQEFNYVDPPAWHYDDSLVTPLAQQSWSNYRGHSDVEVTTHVAGGPSRMRYRTYRGMHGDKTATGSRTVTLTDSEGNVFTDHHYLAGKPLESWSIKPNGMAARVDQHRYWAVNTVMGPTAFQVHAAQYVREAAHIVKQRDESNFSTPTYRRRHVARTFDPTYGVEIDVNDYGDVAVPGDDTCERRSRTPNASAWIVDLPYQEARYQGACGSAAILEKTDTYYDGLAHAAAPTKGNVTAVAVWSAASKRHISRATHDSYGRVTSTMTPAENVGAQRTTTTTYSPLSGRLPDSVTVKNPLGHETKTNFAQGEVTGAVDENDQTTTLTRDALGRVTAVRRPGDPVATITYSYYMSATLPGTIVTGRLLTGTTYVNELEHFDGLGRSIEKHAISPHSSGGRVVTTTRYDARGSVVARSQPFYNAEPLGSGLVNPALTAIPAEQRYEYDSEGRQTAVAQFAHGSEKWRTTTTHDGWRQHVDYPVRNDVTVHSDVFGRATSIVERPSGVDATTRFTYVHDGQIDTIADANGNLTDYNYDWLGQRVRTSDPDQGLWTYTYDENGNQATVTDAKNETLRTTFDALDRPLETWTGFTAGTRRSLNEYDSVTSNGKGRLASTTRYDGGTYKSAITAYDARGNVTGKSLDVRGEPGVDGLYTFGYTYDSAGNVRTSTLPAAGGLEAETLTIGYDTTSGAPRTLTGSGYPEVSYVAGTTYTGNGDVWTRDIGSGTKWRRTYSYDDVAGRLSQLRTEQPNGTPALVESVTFGYDAENNVVSTLDAIDVQYECFRYGDGLGRLTRAFTTASPCENAHTGAAGGTDRYDLGYAYDNIGNITKVEDHVASTTRNFSYTTVGKPHALSATAGTAFTYDANGAMVTRGDATTYTWNPEHQMSALDAPGTADDATFVYHTDGSRLVRRQGGVTTLYLDGMELRSAGGGTPTGTRFYGSVAIRSTDPGSVGLFWMLANRQRSATMSVADGQTNPEVVRYKPFGERRGATDLPGDRGFLGVPTDAGGLVAAGQRYYDPSIGCFLSVDPLMDPSEPQTLNGYAYSVNNPTTFTDPTGLMYSEDDLAPTSPARQPDEVETARDEVEGAKRRYDSAKKIVAESAKKIFQIVMDELGITAGIKCVSEGDAGACAETLLNIAGSLVGGAGFKLLKKYGAPWQWKAAGRMAKTIVGLIDDFVDGVRGLARYADDVKAAEKKYARAVSEAADRCNSFVPGTEVLLADGSSRPIEEIMPGDVVHATDPETATSGPREVTHLITGAGRKSLVDIRIEGHTITATAGHPFWSPASGAWVDAGDLAVGSVLLRSDGELARVTSVRVRSVEARVYNLSGADVHTYYVVGADVGLLVHNSKCDINNPSSFANATRAEAEAELGRDGWVYAGPTRSGDGVRFRKPGNNSDQVRVMRGNSRASNPIKRGPYIRFSIRGRKFGPFPLRDF